MGPDERKIREVHSTWIDAVNNGDLVRLLTLMADDAVPNWRHHRQLLNAAPLAHETWDY